MKNGFIKKGAWLFCGIFLTSLVACQRVGEQGKEAEAPAEILGGDVAVDKTEEAATTGGGALSVANIVFYPEKKEPVVFAVEVAATAEERSKGFQGRASVGERQGMWFIFDKDVRDAFWMKETMVSLDLVFADKDYKVVDIIPNARPNSESLLVPDKDYRYVLEIKAGEAAGAGITVGAKLEYRLGPP